MSEKTEKQPAMADPMKESPDRPDTGWAPAELQRVQQEAADRKPPAVKLARERAKDDDGEAGPPSPVTAKPTPVPRIVHENERAPAGLRRFKLRCLNYGGEQPWRYVLAKDEAAARREYGRATGLDAVLAAVGDGAPPVRLAVRALPD